MIRIKTRLPKYIHRMKLPNPDKEKCPYCMTLFREGEIFVCLSRGENDFQLKYTSFFADLNRVLNSL